MEDKTLVDTLAATLSEKDVKTSGNALGHVRSEKLAYTLTDTLENADSGTLSNKLTNRRAKVPLIGKDTWRHSR